MIRAPVAIALTFAVACSSKAEPPRAEPPPEPAHAEGSGPGERVLEAAADPVGVRPDRPVAGPGPVRSTAGRPGRPIDIVLRSSPPGATAAVDGVPIGPTPTYWSGDANGREHEFTFVMPGYAFARYRFVPITSGVVHARLEVLTEDVDAGVPPELMRSPDGQAPDSRPRTPPPASAPPSTPSAPPPALNSPPPASSAAPPASNAVPPTPSAPPPALNPPPASNAAPPASSAAPPSPNAPAPNASPPAPSAAPSSPHPAPSPPNPAPSAP